MDRERFNVYSMARGWTGERREADADSIPVRIYRQTGAVTTPPLAQVRLAHIYEGGVQPAAIEASAGMVAGEVVVSVRLTVGNVVKESLGDWRIDNTPWGPTWVPCPDKAQESERQYMPVVTHTVSREEIKARGGKIVASIRRDGRREEMWRLPDGSLWSGDDWYKDSQARLVRWADDIELPGWATHLRP